MPEGAPKQEEKIDDSYVRMAEGTLDTSPAAASNAESIAVAPETLAPTAQEVAPVQEGPSADEIAAAAEPRRQQDLVAVRERLHMAPKEATTIAETAPQAVPVVPEQAERKEWTAQERQEESNKNRETWDSRKAEFETQVSQAASTEALKNAIDAFAIEFKDPTYAGKYVFDSDAGWLSADRMKTLIDSYIGSNVAARHSLMDEGFEGSIASRLAALVQAQERIQEQSKLITEFENNLARDSIRLSDMRALAEKFELGSWSHVDPNTGQPREEFEYNIHGTAPGGGITPQDVLAAAKQKLAA